MNTQFKPEISEKEFSNIDLFLIDSKKNKEIKKTTSKKIALKYFQKCSGAYYTNPGKTTLFIYFI